MVKERMEKEATVSYTPTKWFPTTVCFFLQIIVLWQKQNTVQSYEWRYSRKMPQSQSKSSRGSKRRIDEKERNEKQTRHVKSPTQK